MRTCSTRTRSLSGRTRNTRPRLPLSEPVITSTVSLRCNFKAITKSSLFASCALQNFGSERHDLQKLLLAQLAGNRAKHARAYRLAGFVDQNCSVLVEADIGSVAATIFLPRANHHGLHHHAPLDL